MCFCFFRFLLQIIFILFFAERELAMELERVKISKGVLPKKVINFLIYFDIAIEIANYKYCSFYNIFFDTIDIDHKI